MFTFKQIASTLSVYVRYVSKFSMKYFFLILKFIYCLIKIKILFILKETRLEDVNSGLISGIFKEIDVLQERNSKCRKSSVIWNKFSKIQHIAQQKYINYVKCKTCSTFLKFSNKTGTSTLKRHLVSCEKHNGAVHDKNTNIPIVVDNVEYQQNIKKKFTSIIVEWCAKDIKPFDMIIGNGFKKFVQEAVNVGSQYGNIDINYVLPDPRTISRNISSTYTKLIEDIRPEINTSITAGTNRTNNY